MLFLSPRFPFFSFALALIRLALLPAHSRDARLVFQNPSRFWRFELDFDVGDGRTISDELSYHFVVRFVKGHEIPLGGLSVGKSRRVAESEANKQRRLRPIFQAVVPGFRISDDIHKGGIGIAGVDGLQSIAGREVTLQARVMIVIQVLSVSEERWIG